MHPEHASLSDVGDMRHWRCCKILPPWAYKIVEKERSGGTARVVPRHSSERETREAPAATLSDVEIDVMILARGSEGTRRQAKRGDDDNEDMAVANMSVRRSRKPAPLR
jgi:hypothetical protein